MPVRLKSDIPWEEDGAILKDTITGLTLNDFLIMRNWMMYAKKIGDKNYDKFDCDIQISKYMEWQVSRQLDFRKSEYNKNL